MKITKSEKLEIHISDNHSECCSFQCQYFVGLDNLRGAHQFCCNFTEGDRIYPKFEITNDSIISRVKRCPECVAIFGYQEESKNE